MSIKAEDYHKVPNRSRIFAKRLKPTEKLIPPAGHTYRILAGFFYHVTGTTTVIILYDNEGEARTIFASVTSATATGLFYLNNKITTNFVSLVDTFNVPFTSYFNLQLVGAATAYFHFVVQDEWFEGKE